ncbi:MAG: hypothetical protein GC164_15170 [Phycisphaera sp.]|nr:hypothetical protein [Phycisphaera sp.]
MSTEHQQYSTENQAKVITQYSQQRGYEVVASYEDGGKSGLTFGGRQSLQQLIKDVQDGRIEFKNILVYDISRWGRFLDADESAYYEFICKRAGVRVHYCNEQFENDGSIQANVLKGLKRTMAGEYSRELSVKVFQGQCNLIEKGYRQGGPAGYGLRRMLIDLSGQSKGLLKRGEHKSLQTDRVILVPGPDEEVRVVLLIYQMFVKDGRVESEIAAHLNEQGVRTDLGRKWNRSTVRQVLTNEKYIGNNVYNRRSFKLKQKRVINPPDMWIRADGAFDGIVDPALFFTAQGIIQERNRRFTDEEMIELLRQLVQKHTDVSGNLIDETDGLPSAACYRSRFGSLIDAYRLYYTGLVQFRGEYFVGKHEPIINKDTFEHCQRLLKRKNRRTSKVNHYLAASMFVCGHCGFGITAERIRRTNKKDGRVREYVYYRCANVYPDKDHPSVRWREEQLEAAIITDLQSLRIADEDTRQWFRDQLVESCRDETTVREERLKSLRRRKVDLEAMQQRLLDAYLAGAVDKNTFTAKTLKHKEEVDKVEADIQTSRATPLTGLEQAVEAFDLAQTAAERWRVSTKDERRAILEQVLLNRTLFATSLVTTKRKPFDVLAEGPILKQSRTSQAVFEPVPIGFLGWFIHPSLQRNVIEELMVDWVAGTLDDSPIGAYA